MAFLNFVDTSRWQGDIDWNAVKQAGIQGAILKISGGDDGLYYDSKATQNYYGAKSATLLVGGYHFAGGTDPIAEADFFVAGMSPLEDGDVMVLDWELNNYTGNPVEWCRQFAVRVHDKTGVWVILYLNGATRNAYDWSPVTATCGVWIAWYGKDPNSDLPVTGTYIMHQYTSTGKVNGIAGNVDEDAVFMTAQQFESYGYHPDIPPVVIPTPEPTPAPVVDTPPTPVTPIPEPTPTPVVPVPVVEPPVVLPTTTTSTLYDFIKTIVTVVITWLKGWKR